MFCSVIFISISGFKPCLSIEMPFGVNHLAMVTFREELSERGISSWTEPLPKLSSPINLIPLWSLKAPAKISAAEAVPLSIRQTVGYFENFDGPGDLYSFFSADL